MTNQDKVGSEHIETGLPEVAQTAQKRKILIIILVLIFLVIAGLSFWQRKAPETKLFIEENYTIPHQQKPLELKATAAPVTTVVNTQTPPQLTAEQQALLAAKQKELQERLNAPLLIVNHHNNNVNTKSSHTNSPDPNQQFINDTASQSTSTVRANLLKPLNYLIAEGNLIHAVLETAINSDLPGTLRAIVSDPVYSEDGSQVLIPASSRLIGQYKSGLLQGQSRVLVIWNRVITPAGVSIQIGSPGVDNLGQAGIGADNINTHFWHRFGTASLLSIIGAGVSNAGVQNDTPYNSSQAYRMALAESFAQSANHSLQQNMAIAPTLTIHQGTPIMVFVAKDLNFHKAMQQTQPNWQVF